MIAPWKVIRLILFAGTVGASASCQTTGITSVDDPNRVVLASYDVKSSAPGTSATWKDNPLEVEGVMSYPDGAASTGPYPAIIYLLGSGGYNAQDDEGWIDLFNKAGYATLMVNQYTARGLSVSKGLGSAQVGMSDMSFLSDVYAAARALRKNPRIDGARIVTFGSSWGGGIQIFMMSDWYDRTVGNGETIAAHIAVAPACYFTIENPKPTSAKTLILLGEKDDWNQPGPCRDYAARLKAAGGDVSVIEIKDAVHGWYSPGSVRYLSGITVYHCQITWDPETMTEYNRPEGKKHDLRDGGWGSLWDDCVKKQATVRMGGTAEQRKQTESAVFDFLGKL